MTHMAQIGTYAAAALLLAWFSLAWGVAAIRLQYRPLWLTTAGYLIALVPILTWLAAGWFGSTYVLMFIGLCLIVAASRQVSRFLYRRGLRVRDILLFRV